MFPLESPCGRWSGAENGMKLHEAIALVFHCVPLSLSLSGAWSGEEKLEAGQGRG